MNILFATLLFYTRLPLINKVEIPPYYFNHIVQYWPLSGWITAPVMASVIYLGSYLFPLSIAILLGIISRLLLTGALHEDGLADFADGFGGGFTKEQILEIMKDSHIGTYGVLILIFYFLLLITTLNNFPINMIIVLILIGDPLCKGISSFIAILLPYVRRVEDSKFKIPLKKSSSKFLLLTLIFALFPFLFAFVFYLPTYYLFAILPCLVIFGILIKWMKNSIGGFTGDCAGATFLTIELTFYLSAQAICHIS